MFIRRKHLVGAMAVVAAVGLASVATVSAAAPGAAVATTTSVVPTAPPTSEPATGAAGEGTITVAATGTVRVDPDTAVVNLGVQANAATGGEAMDQVNSASAALTEALVASGIAEEDIQTSGLNLFTTTDDRGEISGYQASVQVTVTIRDIATVGATIDTAQQAAGPGFTIGGVSFTFSDPESVLGDARRDAVELARTKAEQYAAAAGLTLGAVVSITEQQADVPLIFDGGARVAAEAAGPSISPGQLDLSVFVTVSYSTTS
jgi:uncharacterized protein YggE